MVPVPTMRVVFEGDGILSPSVSTTRSTFLFHSADDTQEVIVLIGVVSK